MRMNGFGSMLCTAGATLIVAAGLLAAAASGKAVIGKTVGGFASPESVLIHGDRRFVSNVGAALDPLAKDGDGYIAEIAEDGRIVKAHAFPPAGETLDAPKGMAVIGDRLYVTDIDRVVGFDLAGGQRVFDAPLPAGGPSLANDLAVTGDGFLLVTDTLRNAVYRLDPQSKAFTELTADIPGANGIAYDAKRKRIIVAGLGENFSGGDLFVLDQAASPRRLENAPHGLFDGLAQLPDGRLLVSDWVAIDHPVAGRLKLLSEDGAVIDSLDIDLHGPADFALDARTGDLWIPAMVDHEVAIVPLDE
jgi:sugar lactone lactonase YvrE